MSANCRWLVYALVFLGSTAGLVRDVSAADQGRLLFLGVAYNEAPPPGCDFGDYDYAPDNISRIFNEQSDTLFRRIEVENVKGKQATHQSITRALSKFRHKAHADDLFILYWGTHGGTGPQGWGANLPGGGVMYGSELKQELGKFPCPVICIISTCGSGGFAGEKPDGVPLPPNVTAFCACTRKQSTSNELDRALCEALAGFADYNSDGSVTIGEALEYVPLRYRQMFRGGPPTEEDLLPVLAASDATPRDSVLTNVDDTHAAVVHNGLWFGATVLERNDEGTKVRFLGFDSTSTNGSFAMQDTVVTDDLLDLPGGRVPIEVEWNGEWYPARVLEKSRNRWKIHYIGYPDSDDETVPRSRVRFTFLRVPPNEP